MGNRPPGGPNRPNLGDNLGIVNRPNIGNNVNVNRPINSGNTQVNRPVTNIVNAPTNVTNMSSNTVNNVKRINNNVANWNRPGYGGAGRWGGGWGYGGRYGYGGYRPSPYAAYHAGWVNGYWNGHYSGWGWNNWGLNALGLGLGIGVASWGLGSLWNNWGYSTYANPYYATAMAAQPSSVIVQPAVYDYSRPLDLASPPPSQAVIEQSVAGLDSAREAFRAGDYAGALGLADQAIRQTPNDPTLHQFRSICLFALGRYDEAAVPMYAVLSAGPGWDWTTLAGLYPNIAVYTQQLRALESYCNATPQAASARFLLASLYMTQGDNDAAAGILRQVVALQPRDRLSVQLLSALTATPPPGQAQAPPTPEQPPAAPAGIANGPAPAPEAATASTTAPEGPPLPTGPVPDRLIGTWTAGPAPGVAIALTLQPDRTFLWKVTDRGQSRQFQGAATFEGDVLALAPPDQTPMVGTVSWQDEGHFRFKAVGAPPDDPGLSFGH